MTTIVRCSDCKHYGGMFGDYATCKSKQAADANAKLGYLPNADLIAIQRSYNDLCGPSAKFFEKKETLWTRVCLKLSNGKTK